MGYNPTKTIKETKCINQLTSSFNSNHQHRCKSRSKDTLKREPIEENLEDLELSSAIGGKRPATKEHLEAPNKSWCSGTT